MQAPRKPLLAILVSGALLIVLAVFYVRYFIARPIGTGPAGPDVPAAPFEATWTDRPVVLLGIGDSVTAGLGADSPAHTYFNRLLRPPADEFEDMKGKCLSRVLPRLSAENMAMSGTTSDQHLRVVEEEVEQQPADVFGLVVMTTGGNDLIHHYGRAAPRECAMYGATLEQAEPWIANFEQRLTRMLSLVSKSFPGGCQIYLATIYDPTDGVGDAPSIYLPEWPDGLAIHARYNQVIRRVAAKFPHVVVVDLYAAFLGHGSHCRQFWRSTYDAEDPYYWYYDNIEDPNDRGYDAIRRAFLNAIVDNWDASAGED